MVRDYGSPGEPGWRRGERIALVRKHLLQLAAGAALIALFLLPTAFGYGGPGDAPAKGDPAPVLVGPPCRRVNRAAFEAGWREAPRAFAFQGVRFSRRRGDASCATRRAGTAFYPVCQFSVPIEVAIAWKGGEAYFDVGPGYAAAVEARADGPRCVITGRFHLED